MPKPVKYRMKLGLIQPMLIQKQQKKFKTI